jgi:hypothetical protein
VRTFEYSGRPWKYADIIIEDEGCVFCPTNSTIKRSVADIVAALTNTGILKSVLAVAFTGNVFDVTNVVVVVPSYFDITIQTFEYNGVSVLRNKLKFQIPAGNDVKLGYPEFVTNLLIEPVAPVVIVFVVAVAAPVGAGEATVVESV